MSLKQIFSQNTNFFLSVSLFITITRACDLNSSSVGSFAWKEGLLRRMSPVGDAAFLYTTGEFFSPSTEAHDAFTSSVALGTTDSRLIQSNCPLSVTGSPSSSSYYVVVQRVLRGVP